MKKTKTFNEDPDAFQLNDPVLFLLNLFLFYDEAFQSTCSSDLFPFLHAEFCDPLCPPGFTEHFEDKTS